MKVTREILKKLVSAEVQVALKEDAGIYYDPASSDIKVSVEDLGEQAMDVMGDVLNKKISPSEAANQLQQIVQEAYDLGSQKMMDYLDQ